MFEMNKYLAELIGTFALVFCGTGAIVIDQQTNGAVSHVGSCNNLRLDCNGYDLFFRQYIRGTS